MKLRGELVAGACCIEFLSPMPSGRPTVLTNHSTVASEVSAAEAFQPLRAASLTNRGQIAIRFRHAVQSQSSVTAIDNYEIPGTRVTGATLAPDQQGVILNVSGLTGATFTVKMAWRQNQVGDDSSATTSLNGFVLPQTSCDVGTSDDPAVPGVVFSSQPGEFDVLAGGSDIWGSSDHFHYVHELMTGDFDVKARVESFDPINRWAKAVLMVRESLAAGSRQVFTGVTPAGPTVDGTWGGQAQNEYQAEYRAETGLLTATWVTNAAAVGNVPFPNAWIRLRREGDTFGAYRSNDGRTWIQLGSLRQDYPQTVYLGLGTTSHNNNPGFTALARYREYGPTNPARPQ